jgi:Derlin-2/3
MDFGGGGGIGNGDAAPDIMSWYMDIPVVSRMYFTGAFLTTAACAVDIITPYSLYFSWDLIKAGQVWRLFTSYLFFGVFSVDFLFHMYFLVSSSVKEERALSPNGVETWRRHET